MKTVIILNEQHTLLPSQIEALEKDPLIKVDWDILPVPKDGWSREEMDEVIRTRSGPGDKTVVGSPIPYLLGKLAARAEEYSYFVFIFHNDKREAKEVVDRVTGQTRVIHTLASDGWEVERI